MKPKGWRMIGHNASEGMAVGPTHSRGVVGVMSGAGTEPTRRGCQQNAKGCGDVCRAPNRIPHVANTAFITARSLLLRS